MSEAPVIKGARLEHIDALRGLALAGVLLVNTVDLSLYSFLDAGARLALPSAGWDALLEKFLELFVTHKAITIFTVLFGISFALQLERTSVSTERSSSFVRVYSRRLIALAIIGTAHGVLWFGDILRYYAIAGFFLLPTRRLRPVVIAAIGIAVSLFPWTAIWHPTVVLPQNTAPPEQMIAVTFAAFSGSSFWETIKANIAYDLWVRRIEWAFPLLILGRVFLGAALGKSDAMIRPQNHLRFWAIVTAISFPLGIVLSVLTKHAPDNLRPLDLTLRGAASLSMGLSYIAIFVLFFFGLPKSQRWMRSLSAVGRMTLTNYLLQTAICIALFYGIGLGIGPRFGLIGALVLAIVIFALEIFVSNWWIARFNFGPVEWVWRCLSYNSLIPIRPS